MGNHTSRREVADGLHHPENEKLLKKIFRHADKDSNGMLDQEEFASLATIIFQIECEDAHVAARAYLEKEAGTRSGLVEASRHSHTQMAILINANLESHKPIIVAMQKAIDSQDIKKFTEDMFKRLDKDGDQKICFEEFRAFIQEHATEDPLQRFSGTSVKNIETVI